MLHTPATCTCTCTCMYMYTHVITYTLHVGRSGPLGDIQKTLFQTALPIRGDAGSSLVPRPCESHSQTMGASFPDHASLVPRACEPHSQTMQTSLPEHASLVPRPCSPRMAWERGSRARSCRYTTTVHA